MLLLLWLLASSRDMAPKKKLFDKSTGTICDVQYTLYEDGLLKVGTDTSRKTTRLKPGSDLEAAVRSAAGLPPTDGSSAAQHAASASVGAQSKPLRGLAAEVAALSSGLNGSQWAQPQEAGNSSTAEPSASSPTMSEACCVCAGAGDLQVEGFGGFCMSCVSDLEGRSRGRTGLRCCSAKRTRRTRTRYASVSYT